MHTWATALLQWSVILLCVAYLVSTSVGGLAPVASRVIRWASARHKPALSVVVMATLAWTGHGQAQWLWAGTQALACRQALRPCPATYQEVYDRLGGMSWDVRCKLQCLIAMSNRFKAFQLA